MNSRRAGFAGAAAPRSKSEIWNSGFCALLSTPNNCSTAWNRSKPVGPRRFWSDRVIGSDAVKVRLSSFPLRTATRRFVCSLLVSTPSSARRPSCCRPSIGCWLSCSKGQSWRLTSTPLRRSWELKEPRVAKSARKKRKDSTPACWRSILSAARRYRCGWQTTCWWSTARALSWVFRVTMNATWSLRRSTRCRSARWSLRSHTNSSLPSRRRQRRAMRQPR